MYEEVQDLLTSRVFWVLLLSLVISNFPKTKFGRKQKKPKTRTIEALLDCVIPQEEKNKKDLKLWSSAPPEIPGEKNNTEGKHILVGVKMRFLGLWEKQHPWIVCARCGGRAHLAVTCSVQGLRRNKICTSTPENDYPHGNPKEIGIEYTPRLEF